MHLKYDKLVLRMGQPSGLRLYLEHKLVYNDCKEGGYSWHFEIGGIVGVKQLPIV